MRDEHSTPVLRTLRIPESGCQGETTVAWCPYCETLHHHGRGGGYRAAHCELPGAPFQATGYYLDIQGGEAAGESPAPDAPYVGRKRLRDALEAAATGLRSSLLRATLGGRIGQSFDKRVGGARINVCGHSWSIDRDAFLAECCPFPRPVRSGQDFIGLFVALYGVDTGIVGLRLIEAVSGASFDAEARAAIAAVIEAAYARKVRGRSGRS